MNKKCKEGMATIGTGLTRFTSYTEKMRYNEKPENKKFRQNDVEDYKIES